MNIPAGSDIEFQSATLYNKKLPGSIQRFQTGHLIKDMVLIESFACITWLFSHKKYRIP